MNRVWTISTCLIVAALAASFTAQTDRAQAASNLKCNGCVDTKDLAKGSVTKKKLNNRAVVKSKIAAGAVVPSHLRKPTGAAGREGDSVTGISSGEVVSTLKVRVPKPGIVVVYAVGSFRFGSELPATDSGVCGLSKGTTTDGIVVGAAGSKDSADSRSPFAIIRTFVETSGGKKRYRLICNPGPGDDVDVLSTAISATYAPTNILVP